MSESNYEVERFMRDAKIIEMKELKDAVIVKETEKAVNLNILINTKKGDTKWFVWVPKSQIKIEGDRMWMAEWLISGKEDEIESQFTGDGFKSISLITDGEVSEEDKTLSDDEFDNEIPF